MQINKNDQTNIINTKTKKKLLINYLSSFFKFMIGMKIKIKISMSLKKYFLP